MAFGERPGSAVSFRESQHRPAVTGQPLAHRARSPARAFRRGFSSHVLSHASHRLCGRPRTQGLRHGLGSRSPVRLDAPGHGLRPVPCGPRAATSTSTGASSGPSIRCCKVCSLTRPRYRIFLIPSLDGISDFPQCHSDSPVDSAVNSGATDARAMSGEGEDCGGAGEADQCTEGVAGEVVDVGAAS